MKSLKRAATIISAAALTPVCFAVPAFAAETEKTGSKFFTPSVLIPLAILLAAIIACVVVFFILPKRREKTLKFFRSLKSECKKISWYTWKQTRKGTVVVVICAVVIAVVIGLLDYGFSEGINALTEIFR